MSVNTTFIVADGDDLDIIKDWIQTQLETGSTFKAVKVFVIDEKSAYEFESDVVEITEDEYSLEDFLNEPQEVPNDIDFDDFEEEK